MSRMQRRGLQDVPPAGKFIGAVFGFVSCGIGITVLVFLWAAPFGEFGSPPLFFRIFASFIALAFVAVGGATCFASIAIGRRLVQGDGPAENDSGGDEPSRGTASGGYHCPQCGAPLAEGADVSPHGDAKCGHCDCWFNIHGK